MLITHDYSQLSMFRLKSVERNNFATNSQKWGKKFQTTLFSKFQIFGTSKRGVQRVMYFLQ